MSAHRPSTQRIKLRRTFTAAVLAVASGAGFLAAAGPASAAGPWFVKTAALGGNNSLACTSAATACATITGVLAKPGFASGDTINVAAGSYTERPIFSTKGANVVGAGTSALSGTTITNANQAGTSTINVTGSVPVNLTDLRIIGGTATAGIGGGLKIGTGAAGNSPVVTTNNVVIDGNKAVLGAGVVVFAGASYTATGTTISNNVASGTNSAGGGIYNAGTAVINGGSIASNTAPLGGGIVNGLNFSSTGTSITGNTGSTQGGAIYNNGPAQFTTATITGNTSPIGAGAVNAGGTLTFGAAATPSSGGSISTNTSSNAGGAVFVTAGTVNVNNATLSGNTATSTGGGVHVNGGTLNLTGSTLSNNTGGVGGAVYSLTTTNATSTTFNANSSGFGGALAMAGTATLTSSTVSNNTATTQGGAVFNNTGNVTLNGTTLSGNSAPNGGGIYQQAGSNSVTNGSSITGNSATNGNGGGINNTAGTTTVNGSTVATNTATNQGGGIYSAAGTVTVTGSGVNSNTANVLGGGLTLVGGTNSITGGTVSNNSSANGGGLYNGGTLTIDGTTLTANAGNGGTLSNGGNAGAIYNSAALIVKNARFNGNKAVANTNSTPGVTGYGGAIGSFSLAAAGAPTLSFTNTTINGDNAGTPVSGGNSVIGGAIAALGNIGAGGAATTITATGLTLSKNVALAGGGIYSTGPVTLTDSAVTANQATHASAGLGGGIYATPQASATPTLTLDNTDVTGNDGAAGGGGIVTTINTVVKNGSTVNGNSGPIGGGIYSAAPVSVTGSQVNDNTASNSGAGIYSAAAVTMTNSSLDGNSAAFLGGGFSSTATAGSLSTTGGTISGNDAYGAGGVFLANNLSGSFDDTDFVNNTSTGANFGGGAILSAGQVSINKAQITGNTADGASGTGGAIFSGSNDENVTTSLKITNSTLADNGAFGGAAIYAGSNKASSTNKTSISNTTIDGNAATGPFGALELLNKVSIVGATITDNTAVPTNPFDAYGGIVAANAGDVSLSGSVLAGNSGHQCNVAVADGGYNLNNPAASECAFSGAKNDVVAAPGLGALANNGGPTTTRLPSATSATLNKIPATTGTGVTDAITGNAVTLCGSGASDQRGTARPQGAKCDIGAVEAEQIVPVLSGPSSATYSVGIAGAPQSFSATGSPQPTLSATGLPNGITFVDNGDGTGTLAGTPGPSTGGIYPITVKATNEAGSDSKTFTLTITQAPALAGPSAATYTVGTAGGPTTFTTTGHPTSLLSSLGILPSGVGFTDNGDGSGAYAGTPASGTGGTYPLTVKAANGTPPDATKPFTLTVNEAAGLTGPGSATFKVGTSSQSAEFIGSGFPIPTLSATGLPNGLSLAGTGAGKAKISGNAANGTGGVYPGVVVKAANGVAADATQTVNLTVNEAPELVGPSQARFVAGSSKSIGFSSDGFPVATLTKTGTLPAGLSFADNGNGSATISGTAPASAIGTYTVTITASNGQSPDATQTVVIDVVPPLSVTTTTLPNAAFHTAYSAQVMATGGQPAYSFQVISGALPAGLTMNSFGQITGSATAATGTFTFTVKATDSASPAQTATKQLTITLVKGNTQMDVTAIVSGVQPNGDLSINIGLVEADLKGGFPLVAVAGASVKFTSGGKTVCTATSDANGHAQCSQNLLDALLTPLKGSLTATFAGNTLWNGSTATAGAFKPGTSSSSTGGTDLFTLLFGG